MPAPKSLKELYDIGKNEVISRKPELTDFNEGSSNDTIIGQTAIVADEIKNLLISKFSKTYFRSSSGTDLEQLAIDHFGNSFARPSASKAVGVATLSRLNTSAGNVVIPIGTILKTSQDANGVSQRFATTLEYTMTGTEINVSIEAVEAGASGNVDQDTIIEIESALTDPSVTVNNDEETSGGDEIPEDAEYIEYIFNKIITLKGGTIAGIEALAKTVSGVEYASCVEFVKTVIEWDEVGGSEIGDPFKIVISNLYIADANGTANQALIDNVKAAIDTLRATGVQIFVYGSVAQSINWTAKIVLNPAGDNYATLQNDPQLIIDAMTSYLQSLTVGTGFIKVTANAHILSIFGSGGTNDLTSFQTTIPAADVSIAANEKIIPGTIEVEWLLKSKYIIS